MASRVGFVAALVLVATGVATSTAARQSSGTAIYVVHVDKRLCPSPLCGGHWVALANGARTRCVDGLRYPRCYVARAIDAAGMQLDGIADGSLVRGAMYLGRGDLGELVASAAFAPAGRAEVAGGYYRVTDTGIRCVRAPCFSWRATRVNGQTRTPVSGVDLEAAHATASERARALAALDTKSGLLARGRFVPTTGGGRSFEALRLYLRATRPRA